jgi:hypothetical protein
MAHFARINNNNVIDVIVINNQVLVDSNGNESESKGIEFCKQLYGQDTNWIQTSYNSQFRGIYAGIGFTYDPIKDVFVPPKPHESWSLDSDGFTWIAPIPYPQDGEVYFWNEDILNWVKY